VAVVSRVEDDAAVVGAVAADVVAVRIRRANRARVRVVELEGSVEESIVVGEVADAADFRLDVIAWIRLEELVDARGLLPSRIAELTIDDDGARGAPDSYGRARER
jgi:hypothetical protein